MEYRGEVISVKSSLQPSEEHCTVIHMQINRINRLLVVGYSATPVSSWVRAPLGCKLAGQDTGD